MPKVKRNKCIDSEKIHQCEVLLYDILVVEWMQLTDLHNSDVLLAILGLVMSMLKTQNLQNHENYTLNYWNHVTLPLGRVQPGEKKQV